MTRPKQLILWLIALLLIVPVFLVVLGQIVLSPRRALNFLTAQDQALNTVAGGSEDETISSRTGRAALAGLPWARRLAPVIDWFFGAGHCVGAIEGEIGGER